MTVRVKLAALKEGHWYEYVVRFVLGGFATVVAGLVADIWGPVAGGLFLAFPAISAQAPRLLKNMSASAKKRMV